MKINELLSTQQEIDEGIGDFVGRAAGHAVGAAGKAGRGLAGAWQDAKAGYAAAKGSWDPKKDAEEPAAGGTAPAAGGTAAPAAGGDAGRPYVAPAASGTASDPGTAGNIGDLMKQIDALDQPSKQELAGELEKSIASTPAAEPKPTAGAGAFGQMAGQLGAMAPPEQSSTGGTTQQTATGQVHTANPSNPNQAPTTSQARKLAAAGTADTGPSPTTPDQRVAHIAAGGQFDNETGQPISPNGQQQAAPVVPAPAATTPAPVRTGGKVAGQVSQTPNAIRKRDARSIKADQARMATGTNEGVNFYSNFLGQTL